MHAMTKVSDLNIYIAINTYMMGLRPDTHMEISLNIQKLSTLPKLLSRAKLYIESKDILLAMRSNYYDFYFDSQKGKKTAP